MDLELLNARLVCGHERCSDYGPQFYYFFFGLLLSTGRTGLFCVFTNNNLKTIFLLRLSSVLYKTFGSDTMVNKTNVNSGVPLETPEVNPIMSLDTSTVNSLLVGEVRVILPSVATTTPVINSFVRNMSDLVMSQYMSQGNVPMANPYMNS
ncbi:hypothetical protein Ddye_019862, partial [Dipteronia dyeriana]